MDEEVATGSDNFASTELTRFNAVKHGILSQCTVLPWEDDSEYEALFKSLNEEHKPDGPTEQHLVEELAGIIWRKRRLRLAEAAAHRRGLEQSFGPFSRTAKAALTYLGDEVRSESVPEAIRATADDTAQDIADMEEDEVMTHRALSLLSSHGDDGYHAALGALREDTVEWWQDELAHSSEDDEAEDQQLRENSDDLREFLELRVMPWFQTRRKELENRPLIREQAFGEALDTNELDKLGRYEIHLDRKLERMLAMLIKLKDLRYALNRG